MTQLGSGLCNLVDSIIEHRLHGLHQVSDLPVHVPSYDWIFLLDGRVGLIVLGWVLGRVRESVRLVVSFGASAHDHRV